MKSFIQLISESVPNRSQANIFKSFYKGKIGVTKKDDETVQRAVKKAEDTSVYDSDTLEHDKYDSIKPKLTKMKSTRANVLFPSFTGRRQKQKIRFKAATGGQGEVNDLRFMTGKGNINLDIDPVNVGYGISKRRGLGKTRPGEENAHVSMADILAHELTHTTQSRLRKRGLSGLPSKLAVSLDTLANLGKLRKSHLSAISHPRFSKKRSYIDVIGNRRTTDDTKYAIKMLKDRYREMRDYNRAINQSHRRADWPTERAGYVAYMRSPHEQEARIIGAIAGVASYTKRNPNAQFPSFADFTKLVRPGKNPSRSLMKKIRKTYGRTASAYQDISKKRVNPR